jgi:hypothetical protein
MANSAFRTFRLGTVVVEYAELAGLHQRSDRLARGGQCIDARISTVALGNILGRTVMDDAFWYPSRGSSAAARTNL